MIGFALRRCLGAVPTLFVVVTLSFFLMRWAPGGPFDLERPLEAKIMENLQRVYGLDLPLYEQYLRYLSNLLQGDLGPSFFMRDFTVGQILGQNTNYLSSMFQHRIGDGSHQPHASTPINQRDVLVGEQAAKFFRSFLVNGLAAGSSPAIDTKSFHRRTL